MQIPLANSTNHVAHIDPADAYLVAPHTWFLMPHRKKLYAAARIKRRRVLMHRLLMGEPVGMLVDHKDGDGLNNRRRGDAEHKPNLRACTKSQNMGNCKPHSDRKGRYKGVCYEKQTGRYVAQICCEGVIKKVGRFKTALEAAKAYDAEAIECFQQFAHLNFPPEGKKLADHPPKERSRLMKALLN